MLKAWARIIRNFLIGRRVTRALERHNRAADELDALVQEVLKR